MYKRMQSGAWRLVPVLAFVLAAAACDEPIPPERADGVHRVLAHVRGIT